MNTQEVRNITNVFNKFLLTENNPKWEPFDDNMSYLEYLEDSELVSEAHVMLIKHSQGSWGCGAVHENCPISNVLEAVESILELQKTAEKLHVNNRYILEFYLTMSQMGEIVPDPTEQK